MAHIQVEPGVPGIRSLVMYRPETGRPLYELVQVLLRGTSTLTEGERELIAAFVSHRNECMFCRNSHAAAATCFYGEKNSVVADFLYHQQTDQLSDKIKSLLHIAGKVQVSGKEVQPDDIETARRAGATDRELHDTVLIAATFCMFNRYVDGLASYTPTDENVYTEMGKRMVNGYHFPRETN